MTDERLLPRVRGRVAQIDPPNRFEKSHRESDLEHVADDEEYIAPLGERATEYIPDRSRSVISENNSPDIGFRFGPIPYRGCLHGCSYCYARPSHKYLGYSAGIDFESKILVKEEAPELFREFLRKPSWRPESIAMSGVTDPYQPAERRYEPTRRRLEIALEAGQPMSIITKNSLIRCDVDLPAAMALRNFVHVNIS